jgi:hypothetical protein
MRIDDLSRQARDKRTETKTQFKTKRPVSLVGCVGGRGWGSYRGQGLASQMEEHWSQQLEELASEHGERELEVLCDVHYALVLQRSGSAAVVP